ncbi:MAG TPA: hypothetical protein VL172_03145 [Kofleriaceae bacterium]|nr:hypothetical protein [Kofleriaceae bacterium]
MGLLRIATLALLVGCYQPAYDACQVLCGEGQPDCPDGTNCRDGYCQKPGEVIICRAPTSAVSAGKRFTCAVGDDGFIYCWGDNRTGQLGTPSIDRTGVPRLAQGDRQYVQVQAGGEHVCAIDVDGGLWCWGRNSAGQIGSGNDNIGPDAIPFQVTTPAGDDGFTAVAVNGAFTLAIQRGTLWGWGTNELHQLGTTEVATETGVPVNIDDTRLWTQVVAGVEHACALAGDELYCWGHGDLGRLGLDDQLDRPTPSFVAGSWRTIAAGDYHTCGIGGDSVLYCWGANDAGQVGSTAAWEEKPFAVDQSHTWVSVDAGWFHTCAITDQGELFCFGEGVSGQLGDGLRERHDQPTAVPAAIGESGWASVSAGGDHTCAVSAPGGARYCWGSNSDGQDGDGQMVDEHAPAMTADARWLALSAGPQFTCGHKGDAAGSTPLFCWGANRMSQLGDGTVAYRTAPKAIDSGVTMWNESPVGALVAGGGHACGLDATNAMWCWGSNDSGQLGTGDLDPRPSPDHPDDSVVMCWIAVSAGLEHTCAIADEACTGATTGSIYCWGTDRDDQLANGTGNNDVTSPGMIVAAASDWTGVWSGGGHTCATKASGLWCWGDNQAGETGVGSSDPSVPTPTMVDGGVWTRVSMSPGFPGHTCGIQDGDVMCWGEKSSGELGAIPDNTDNTVPFAVPGLGADPQSEVCAGLYHSCAIDSTGVLRCWGGNDRGQIGDGSTDQANEPAVFAGSWLRVTCGDEHTCAIKDDESLWCWGRNEEGQLGNGAVTPSAPTAVLDF